MAKKPTSKLTVETLKHDDATRKNIPTAEYQSVMQKEEQSPIRVAYDRRNRDLDPQLVWRGKDEQDWSDLVVHAPPLYIQEKVHPKVLIDDLKRFHPSPASGRGAGGEGSAGAGEQFDLFADFNGLPDDNAKTEFYQHDARWANRMILGDSQQVMASLAEREGLRGKVQCIYFELSPVEKTRQKYANCAMNTPAVPEIRAKMFSSTWTALMLLPVQVAARPPSLWLTWRFWRRNGNTVPVASAFSPTQTQLATRSRSTLATLPQDDDFSATSGSTRWEHGFARVRIVKQMR